MPEEPLAYHITWTTYGTWLSGDQRGWVESGTSGVQAADLERKAESRSEMAGLAVTLSEAQRVVVEQTIREHCRIRAWVLHALNVRTNHIHVVASADRHPDEIMSQFKAWCSRKLSDQAGLTVPTAKKAGRKKWFTEHGSTKWI